MSKPRSRVTAIVAGSLIAGATLAAGTLSLAPAKGADLGATVPANASATLDSGSLASAKALSGSFAEVVEKASPAVVFIDVEKKVEGMPAGFPGGEGGPGIDPFRFFGPGGPGRGPAPSPFGEPTMRGQGTGFIVTDDGYIVTNSHVAGDADRMRVTLADGSRFDATLVGSDPQTEIAVVKIDATGLPTVRLGDSNALRVGEWVIAIGNPFGLNQTVTSGIVSARGRGNVGIVDYADFIQTDAAINPGNSGGPLLNLNGEVVGMNTAIISPSGASAGIGFAIPVNMVKYVVDELRSDGTVTRGYLGIGIQDLTPDLARWFGIEKGRGVLVAEVSPGSPADKAGLERDDVILELNGRPVGESGAFRSHVSTTAPGSDITVALLRDGKRLEKTVNVGTLANDPEAGGAEASEPETRESSLKGKLGVGVQPLNADLAGRLGYEDESGLVVTEVAPGSPAARAGIRPGTLIKEVNRQPVKDLEGLKQALKKGSKDDTALLRVREGAGTRYVAVDIA